MDSLQQLSFSQKFNELQIESEHQTIMLKDVNLSQSMTHVQQILNDMHQSRFYKHVKVYFGTKTKQNINYLEEHYNKKEQILNLSLEEQKQYLKNIVSAQNEESLKMIELMHQQNQLVIQKRLEKIDNVNYHPCIYIHTERKGPLFGSIQQDINRHGAGTLSALIGYRSPLQRYDNVQFNLEWPLQTKFNKRYYQLGLSWNNPLKKYGDFFFKYNSGNDATYENVDTNSNGFSWGLNKGQQNYEVEWSYRIPFIHRNISNEIKKGMHHPSTKFSLKYNRILENTIRQNTVTQGQFSQIKTELGLPFIGSSNFLRLEYNQRNFFDTFGARKHFQNDWLRAFLWKSTLETNFTASTIAQYGKKHYINDTLQPVDVRGFHSHKRPLPSYANFRGSVKFNIHNYPYISQANIIYFMYSQLGLSFLKNEPFSKPFCLGSTGIGLSFNFGPASLELLCNLAQFQNKRLREPSGFQFRFSIND